MALVVVREHQAGLLRVSKPGLEDPSEVDLRLHPHRKGQAKTGEPRGGIRQIGLQKTIEFRERLLVVDDKVQLIPSQARLTQAIFDGLLRERCIMALPGETLLLGGSHDLPIHDQRSSTVMVEG